MQALQIKKPEIVPFRPPDAQVLRQLRRTDPEMAMILAVAGARGGTVQHDATRGVLVAYDGERLIVSSHAARLVRMPAGAVLDGPAWIKGEWQVLRSLAAAHYREWLPAPALLRERYELLELVIPEWIARVKSKSATVTLTTDGPARLALDGGSRGPILGLQALAPLAGKRMRLLVPSDSSASQPVVILAVPADGRPVAHFARDLDTVPDGCPWFAAFVSRDGARAKRPVLTRHGPLRDLSAEPGARLLRRVDPAGQ